MLSVCTPYHLMNLLPEYSAALCHQVHHYALDYHAVHPHQVTVRNEAVDRGHYLQNALIGTHMITFPRSILDLLDVQKS